jgi:hypothetical protein
MTHPNHKPAAFPLGRLVLTTNAARRLAPRDITEGLRRHAAGDWGELDPSDAALNDSALGTGDRLLSAYGAGDRRFWIITEADRSVTTVLLPEDY